MQMEGPGFQHKREKEEATPWWQLWGAGSKRGRDGNEGGSTGGGNSDSYAAAAHNAAGGTGAGRRGSKDAWSGGEGGEGAVLWAAQPGAGPRGTPRPLSLLQQQSLSGSVTQAQELAALRELQEQQPQARKMRSPARVESAEHERQEAGTLPRPASAAAAAVSPLSNRPASLSPSDSRTAAVMQYGRGSSTDTGMSSTMAGVHSRSRTTGGSFDPWREAGSSEPYGNATAAAQPRSGWRRAAAVGALEAGGDAGAVEEVLGRPDLERPAGTHNVGTPPARGGSFAAAAAAALAAAERGASRGSPARGAGSPWSTSVAAAGGARSSSGASPWAAECGSPHTSGPHGIRVEAAAGAPGSAPASPGETGLAASRSAWRRAAEAAALDAGGTEGTVREVCGNTPERSVSSGGLVQVRPGSARARPVPLRPGLLAHAEGGRAYTEGGQGSASAGIGSSPLSRGNGGSARSGGGGDSPGAVRAVGVGSRTHLGATEAHPSTEPPWRWPGGASGAAKDGAAGGRQDSWAGHNPLFRDDGGRSDSDRGDDAGHGADAGGMSVHGAEDIGGGRNASVRFRGMRDSEGEEAGSPHGHDSRLVYVRQQSGGSSRNGSPARTKSAWRVAVDASAGSALQAADGEAGFVMGSAPLRPKSGRRSAVQSDTAGPGAEPLPTPAAAAAAGSARGNSSSPRTASSLTTATHVPDEETEGGHISWPSTSGSQQPGGNYAYPAAAAGRAGATGFLAQRLAGGGMRGSEPGAGTRGSGSAAALDVAQSPIDRARAPAAGERWASGGHKAVAWASEVSKCWGGDEAGRANTMVGSRVRTTRFFQGKCKLGLMLCSFSGRGSGEHLAGCRYSL